MLSPLDEKIFTINIGQSHEQYVISCLLAVGHLFFMYPHFCWAILIKIATFIFVAAAICACTLPPLLIHNINIDRVFLHFIVSSAESLVNLSSRVSVLTLDTTRPREASDMLCARDARKFEPHGRQCIELHPGQKHSSDGPPRVANGRNAMTAGPPLVRALRDFTITEQTGVSVSCVWFVANCFQALLVIAWISSFGDCVVMSTFQNCLMIVTGKKKLKGVIFFLQPFYVYEFQHSKYQVENPLIARVCAFDIKHSDQPNGFWGIQLFTWLV